MGFIFVMKKLYCFHIVRNFFRIFGPFNFAEEIDLTFRMSSTRNVEILMSSAFAEDIFESVVPISHSATSKKQIKMTLGIKTG